MTSHIDVTVPDPRMYEILTGLDKWELRLIENQGYVETDVYFDGREFRNCSFRNCNIFIKIGHFRISGQKLVFVNCKFNLDGPASAVKSVIDLITQQR